MNNTRKTLFIISGILSILVTLSIIITVIFIYLNYNLIDTLVTYLQQYFETETGYLINSVTMYNIVNFGIVVVAISALPNIFITVVSFVGINKSGESFERFKPVLILTIILAILFSNVVVFVLLLVALLVKNTPSSNGNIQVTTDPNKARELAMTKEIESIKNLLAQGAISQQEYDMLIKDLFNRIEKY